MAEDCGDGSSAVTGWLSIAEPHLGSITRPKPVLELGHDARWTADHIGQVGGQETSVYCRLVDIG